MREVNELLAPALEWFNTAAEELVKQGVAVRKHPFRFQIPQADEWLDKGMQYVIGDHQTLPEYEKIAQWLSDNKGRGLMLMGSCGVGKSVICCKVIPLIMKARLNRIFRPIPAMQFAKLDEVGYRALWIIDDLGTEGKVKDYGTEKDNVSDLLETIDSIGGCAIITTNLTAQEFRDRYGDRNYDRIKANFTIVAIKSKSMRQ